MGKTKQGLFVGYVLNAGGGWTGDVDVLDAVELTNALLHSEVHCRRVSSNEIQIEALTETSSFQFGLMSGNSPSTVRTSLT